jgi:hypothetical protein
MRSVLVTGLLFFALIATAENPKKIYAQYISQEAAKKTDALNYTDVGVVIYKENSTYKLFESFELAETFLATADFNLLQQHSINPEKIYIISPTGQEAPIVFNWDENLQKYVH